MTAHVIAVDAATFESQLNYMFIGTGAGEHEIRFNSSPHSGMHYRDENMLAGMMADSSRIRRGDQIFFHLRQGPAIPEGMFFGVFSAVADGGFLDDNDGGQFLRDQLGKSLPFRALIAADEVYAEGATEWEVLDGINNTGSPSLKLSSLIYGKLRGGRENTMLTMREAERLRYFLRKRNRKRTFPENGRCFSFDASHQKITSVEGRYPYKGRRNELNILPRLLEKHARESNFETHLQAYIAQHIGRGINPSLDAAILGAAKLEWLGNNYSCGVGARQIALMASVQQGEERVLLPVEITSATAGANHVRQIQRYVDWLEIYYLSGHPGDLQPVLLAKHTEDKTRNPAYRELVDALKQFHAANGDDCNPIKLVEFSIDGNDLSFSAVPYA